MTIRTEQMVDHVDRGFPPPLPHHASTQRLAKLFGKMWTQRLRDFGFVVEVLCAMHEDRLRRIRKIPNECNIVHKVARYRSSPSQELHGIAILSRSVGAIRGATDIQDVALALST